MGGGGEVEWTPLERIEEGLGEVGVGEGWRGAGSWEGKLGGGELEWGNKVELAGGGEWVEKMEEEQGAD